MLDVRGGHVNEKVVELIKDQDNDIIIKIWNSIESYSPEKSKFTTWLTVVVRNSALNYLRCAAESHEEQHIFYRKYYYLQRTAQIAAELGMTERSVEGKLYRLRKKLQKELGGDFR